MTMNIVRWAELDGEARRRLLERPLAHRSEELEAVVRAILRDVRTRGDAAVLELTSRFDRVDLATLEIGRAEMESAARAVAPSVLADLREAIRRITLFHEAERPLPIDLETSPGVRCERRFVPIRRVGLYVPGGTAPLPSTVLMLGVPAAIAGCEVRVLATPPRADGSVDPHILVAAGLLGITRIFKVGGAQAIAALAYGTASVPRVDKIFGPGNSWVTEAKLQVARDPSGAACDLPAGPSEVLVIADQGANALFVAADLLAQAEHGPDSQVVLVSTSRALLERAASEVLRQVERLPRREIARAALARSVLVEVDTLADAMAVSNDYAPEHLILHVADPRAHAGSVRNAGSVFLGQWTPETAGDYASGTNHVLPTYGFARAFGGLTTESFLKSITFQEMTTGGLAELGPLLVRLAEIEKLEGHAQAVRVRLAASSS